MILRIFQFIRFTLLTKKSGKKLKRKSEEFLRQADQNCYFSAGKMLRKNIEIFFPEFPLFGHN